MSIAFGGAMKDMDDDALRQALRAMRKAASKRKRIVAIRRICRRYVLEASVFKRFKQ